jgi:hypothetical protein
MIPITKLRMQKTPARIVSTRDAISRDMWLLLPVVLLQMRRGLLLGCSTTKPYLFSLGQAETLIIVDQKELFESPGEEFHDVKKR